MQIVLLLLPMPKLPLPLQLPLTHQLLLMESLSPQDMKLPLMKDFIWTLLNNGLLEIWLLMDGDFHAETETQMFKVRKSPTISPTQKAQKSISDINITGLKGG